MRIIDLGVISYSEALHFQQDVLSERIAGRAPDTIIVLEHKPVVTFGRSFDPSDILDRGFFEDGGFEIIRTSRGGKITCHMPGQLVVYPVLDLVPFGKDISGYIDMLQDSAVSVLRSLDVAASVAPGKRGVWVSGNKIAFIGIKVTRWVAYHGIAINLNNDLEAFRRINPCGEPGIKVTSAAEELGSDVDMVRAKDAVKTSFKEAFARGKERCALCG